MKFSKNSFCLKKKTSSRLLSALPKMSFWKGQDKKRDCVFYQEQFSQNGFWEAKTIGFGKETVYLELGTQ
jgi:hypothetical protein